MRLNSHMSNNSHDSHTDAAVELVYRPGAVNYLRATGEATPGQKEHRPPAAKETATGMSGVSSRPRPASQRFEPAGCSRSASSRPERLLNLLGRSVVSILAQHRRHLSSKLCGLDPPESHPESSSRLDDLFGHDGLVVANRGEHQWQAMAQGLADRVVATVADDRVEVAQKL